MIYRFLRFIILPAVLYRCDTWSLILMEEHRLSVREWGAEGDIWTSPKKEEVTGNRVDYMTRSFMILTADQLLLGSSDKKDDLGKACDTDVGEKNACSFLVRQRKSRFRN